MTQSLPQPLIIWRRSVINTPVVPNRYIIRILPAVSDLQVVIFHNQLHEPFQQRFRFQGCHVIDVLHVGADCEDGFPPGNRISANDGMDGGEIFANVVGGAAGVGVEFEVICFGRLIKLRLRVGSG